MADRDLVYTDAYFGAAVGMAHSDSAKVAAAILSSSFASWFFLLTAAEFGVWKRRLLTNDVRNLPMPDLGKVVTTAVGAKVLAAQDVVRANPLDQRKWAALDDAVCDLYGLAP